MDYTVGDLAKRSGLTVRTLHHYEQLGLLVPSTRSDSGYRLYGEADVRTLHRILAYRQMGLPLKDIGPLLSSDTAPPLKELLERQIAVVEAGIAEQQRLLAMLRRVERRAVDGAESTDDLLQLITAQQILERHYSHDDMTRLRALQDAIPPETIAMLKTEIPALLSAFRAAKEAKQTDPDALLALARRWLAMERLVPVDDELRRKGRQMLGTDASFQQMSGIDPALAQFIDDAVAAAKAADGGAA
jgi:MerR family transcriptional regulator, thiopeptide resistance regulator